MSYRLRLTPTISALSDLKKLSGKRGHMAEDDEAGLDFEQIADIGSDVMDVLTAENIVVELRGGDEIRGSLVGFSIRKKTPRKEGKEATCSATVSVQTKQGVLQINCETVTSVKEAPAATP